MPTRSPPPELFYPLPAGARVVYCKRCPRPMVYVTTATRARLPIDLTTLRHVVMVGTVRKSTCWEAQSHFQTCPHAAEFSNRGRKENGSAAQKRTD